MKSYSVLAKYYDKFSQNDCDYERWSQYLFAKSEGRNVKNVVDLACGTGKMTKLLAKNGFCTVGVDGSSEMLSQAQGKCKAVFVLQDMKKLSLPRQFDMAVCVNDGVNYVKGCELVAFFQKVAQNLKCGAPFVFDVSTESKFRKALADEVFYVDCDDETLLWTNELFSDRIEMSLTLFEKRADGSYVRSDEKHLQYVHREEDVKNALFTAGFEVEEVSSDYGLPYNANAFRLTYCAVKR